MPRSFPCQKCGADIVVKYLRPGEQAVCRKCGEWTPVPGSAKEVEMLPEYLVPRLESRESQVCDRRNIERVVSPQALARERNLLVASFLILVCLAVFLDAREIMAPPDARAGIRAMNLVLTWVAKVILVYQVFRVSTFLRQPSWLTLMYGILTVLSLKLYLIPFLGLLLGLRSGRRNLLRSGQVDALATGSEPVCGDSKLGRTVRVRTLLLLLLLASVVTAIIVSKIWPEWSHRDPGPLAHASSSLIFQLAVIVPLFLLVRSKRVDMKAIFGQVKVNKKSLQYLLVVPPLVALCIGAFFVVFLPLSVISPKIAKWVLMDHPDVAVWTRGEHYVIADVISFISIAMITPVMEEFLFRGLILSRWSVKWNVLTAAILSSICFGMLHVSMIGAFFFGYVMCVIYVQTRSLLIPMAAHALNNGLLWFLMLSLTAHPAPAHTYNLKEFQHDWPWGVVGLSVGIPWAIWFLRKNKISKTTTIPACSKSN